MNKSRLEAFSDGVLAIIITIMVLEIKVPHGADWANLKPMLPILLSYTMSFLLIGIYWGNHHNMLHTIKTVNANIMLANLNLLFWLSLMPVATGWMGENEFAPNTIVAYAAIALLCGVAYGILQQLILKSTSAESPLKVAIRKQSKKVVISAAANLLAIPVAFIHPAISCCLFVIHSCIWLIPDRNVERAFDSH